MRTVPLDEVEFSKKGRVIPFQGAPSEGHELMERSFLHRVLEQKRTEVGEMKKKKLSLEYILRQNEMTVIAEVKRASPSQGIIQDNFDPEEQLRKYVMGGAGAISVLTDRQFFKGGQEILQRIRSMTDLPVLRKDFIIDPLQVYESKFLGADVILLILAILDDKKLQELLGLAHSLGLEAILEVHHKDELCRALHTEGRIIGINNRNLDDFSVDLSTTERIMDEYRHLSPVSDRLFISESGIRTAEQVAGLASTGIKGVLVGETLMRSDEPDIVIRNFLGSIRS